MRVEDIFNTELPQENRRLYRLANRLHLDSRPEMIRSQLLFATGQPYSSRLLRETERLLRGRKYLYDCSIRPLGYRDNRVDLEVWVKDVWTLKVAAALSRSGGASEKRLELQDHNFLGSGKSVSVRAEDAVDRTSLSFQYRDSKLLGSWVHLDALYSDNSDGERIELVLNRPFFALDSRWAAGVRIKSDQRLDTLYALGKPSDSYRHRQEEIEIFGGLSRGLGRSRTWRWLAGATYLRDRFADAPDGDPARRLPDDLELAYPWVGFESAAAAFDVTRNQDQIGRTEDVPLGESYGARLGFAPTALGARRDQLVFRGALESGRRPSEKAILLATTAASGRWSRAGFEDLLARAEGRFYRRSRRGHLFFAGLELAAARDLDGREVPKVLRVGADRRIPLQLLLGGDTGLRGYPLRYQDGEGLALLTLEQRFFTGLYPLRLGYVGAAVFVDVGRTWPGEHSAPNLGWLSDVGFGLRFSSNRSGFGSVVHFDVAFPLDRQGSIDSVQWLVTTKQSL